MSGRQCSRGEWGCEALGNQPWTPRFSGCSGHSPITQRHGEILDFEPEELGQSSWPATLTVRVKQAMAIFSILGAVFVSVLEIERFIIRDWVWIKRLRSPSVCCLQAGGTEEQRCVLKVWQPESQGRGLQSKGLRINALWSIEARKVHASAQHSGRKWIQPSSAFLFCFRTQRTHLGEGHHLLSAQFSYSNANVFQKHLHRYVPQSNA